MPSFICYFKCLYILFFTERMTRFYKFFLPVFLILIGFGNTYAQIKIKELPPSKPSELDSVYFDVTQTRNISELTDNWIVFPDDEPEAKIQTNIPATFEGRDELIFAKELNLSQNQILKNRLKIFFEGLNYSAEISLNNLLIHKHPGGQIPFWLELPRDVLKLDGPNVISIKLKHDLDAKSTIPVKQRFLLPQSSGGIIRKVYLHSIPDFAIAGKEFSYNLTEDRNYLNFESSLKVYNPNYISSEAADDPKNNIYEIKIFFTDSESSFDEESPVETEKFSFSKPDAEVRINGRLRNPKTWSPENPLHYSVRFQLVKNDTLIDETVLPVSLYDLESDNSNLALNGNPFYIKGTVYYNSYMEFGNSTDHTQIEKDLSIIKNMGFNSVRFVGSAPHPYALRYSEKIGLLNLIEIPINAVPTDILTGKSFTERSDSYLKYFLKAYKNYSSVAAIGVGSSYLPDSNPQREFISSLASIVKESSGKLVFASFNGFPAEKIDSLDLYGIDLFVDNIVDHKEKFENSTNKLGKGNLFISSAAYPSFYGNTNGYMNKFSLEAQAKYFEDLIDFAQNENISGFFINSIFDLQGDFNSLSLGYNDNKVYNIGILREDRSTTGLTYNVVKAKLNNAEKITIPIGTKSDDAPIFFIISGLVLAILMGILMNSKRKFREDASRALLRPYNFFADIRDQRILSGLHSNFLMIILSGSLALLFTNILFYFKTSLLIERLAMAFGSESFLYAVSFLAWNPVYSFVALFILSVFFFLVLSLILKISSFFIRNRVLFSSIYFMVIWALMPLVLLIPIELVLYRILTAAAANTFIYIFLIVYFLWLLQRLMKGIYVIFDIAPFKVYGYAFLFIFALFIITLVYFQLTESTIYYALNAFKQSNAI